MSILSSISVPRLGWLAPPVLGLGLAVYMTKRAERLKVFEDYCAFTGDPSAGPPRALTERLRHLYGEEFAKMVEGGDLNTKDILTVLSKKATLRYWLSDPVKLLSSEDPTPEAAEPATSN